MTKPKMPFDEWIMLVSLGFALTFLGTFSVILLWTVSIVGFHGAWLFPVVCLCCYSGAMLIETVRQMRC